MKKMINIFMGTLLSSLGIACVLNSDLGCFAITASYKAISNWLNIPLAAANILIELSIIVYVIYKGEGLGWTAIINATFGSIMINIFHVILPHTPILCLGILLMPLGWSMMGKAGMGDTGTNILTRVLMKNTGKSLSMIRIFIDGAFLIIAYIGAPQYVTLFTIIITFGCGPLMQLIYKIVNYKPVEIEHKFLISKKIS